jgi:hypothetical protein
VLVLWTPSDLYPESVRGGQLLFRSSSSPGEDVGLTIAPLGSLLGQCLLKVSALGLQRSGFVDEIPPRDLWCDSVYVLKLLNFFPQKGIF